MNEVAWDEIGVKRIQLNEKKYNETYEFAYVAW